MDFTNRYAIMCRKAAELQEEWAPKPCDFFIEYADIEEAPGVCSPASGKIQVVDIYIGTADSDEYRIESEHLRENSFWLPRQDQLQKIIEPDDSRVHSVIGEVIGSRYLEGSTGDYVEAPRKFYSMEQIWLAFVMKERYGKIWNEEDWVGE